MDGDESYQIIFETVFVIECILLPCMLSRQQAATGLSLQINLWHVTIVAHPF